VRVAGPSAVKLSSTGVAVSRDEPTVRSESTPALSGVPSFPDLTLPRHTSSLSTEAASTQILNQLRATVTAQPDLQLDILGILDTMGARFEAAKKEMAAAQGVDWENGTWDLAAEHLRIKKAGIEKWCAMVATAAGEGRIPLTDVHGSVYEGSREAMDVLPEQSDDDFGWVTSGYDWGNLQWESAIFDEVLQDIHS
jgi:hypothetical protein